MALVPDWARRSRAGWKYRGQERPPFAIEPGPGQESVWDYPRPPALHTDSRVVRVRLGDVLLAESTRAVRVLETASPPTFYLPPGDVVRDALQAVTGQSMCEWKGEAAYWGARVGTDVVGPVAWSYPDPFPEFESIAGYYAFYPDRLECTVGAERVKPQAGGFYGGWVTSEIVGPMKGDPGSSGW